MRLRLSSASTTSWAIPSRHVLACGLLALTLACTEDAPKVPGVSVIVLNHQTGARPPSHLVFSWWTDEGFTFRDLRVPHQGPLVPDGDTLAKILVDTRTTQPGARRYWVRGYFNGNAESHAAGIIAMVPTMAGLRETVTVRLTLQPLPDDDGDGIPDSVDLCPFVANPEQRLPCPPRPDGGITDAMPVMDTAPFLPDTRPPMDAMEMRDVEPDLPVDTGPPAGNIIRNPGFEDGTMHWENRSATAGAAREPGHAGMFALNDTDPMGEWRQRIQPFWEDATYRLSAWGRSGAMGNRCTIGLQYRDRNNTLRLQSLQFNNPDNNFVRVETTLHLPVGAQSLNVLLNNNGNRDCWWDEIELTVTPN